MLDDFVEIDPPGVGLGAVELLHLADEHIFIVGTVEDGDLPLGGHLRRDAPQIVMGQLVGAGRLESGFMHAMGRKTGQHRADRAVLSCCIHRLEKEDDPLLLLGIQLCLQLVNAPIVLRHLRFRVLAVNAEAGFIG